MDKKCAPNKNYENGSCFSLNNLINIGIHINKKLCAISTAKVSFLNGDHKNRGRQAHSPFL